MRNLKINVILSLLCVLVSACQSTRIFGLKTFHSSNREGAGDLHVIQVSSSRVKQKCLFLNAEAENKWRHQYFMYVLNDKNEALEIMQPTNQDEASCYSQIRRVEKVLKSESKVKICVRDELKRNTQDYGTQNEFIQFDALGKRKVTYEPLTLDSICNEKECFSNNDIWTATCPGFEKR